MTVVTDPVTTPAGEPDDRAWSFARVLPISEDDDGTGIVTARAVNVLPVSGVLTTPDLEPGEYIVRYRSHEYPITVPHSVTPVRLWPLIAAGTPGSGVGGGGTVVTWSSIIGKPATFPPAPHIHVIGDVTGLQAALDAASAGGRYIASDTGDEMRIIAFSNGTVKAVPYAAIPPDTPIGLTGTVGVASVSLTWSPAARASQYRVYRNSLVLATVNGAAYIDYTAATGVTYTYKVQAVDQYGQMSGISAGFDATPDPSLNVAPTIELRTWPATLPETGIVLVRANVQDVDAQSLIVALGISNGTITPTQDPSLWRLTL